MNVRSISRTIAVAAVLLFSTCEGGTAPGVRVLFDLSGEGSFFDAPFPSDLRLTSEGHIDLSGFPGSEENALLRMFLGDFSEMQGFGLNAPVYFRFSGPLDPTFFPTSAESLEDGSPAFLVNIEADSTRRGERIPIQLAFYQSALTYIPANLLAVVPLFGFPLEESARYAVVITRELRDGRGARLDIAPDFEAVKTYPSEENASTLFRPLWEFLEEQGMSPDEVAAATVFTTRRATGKLFAIREYLERELDPPRAESWQTYSESGDYLTVFTAEYPNPEFQAGMPPFSSEGGSIEFDSGGDPVLQRTVNIRFSLTAPDGQPPDEGWPLLVYGHGSGGGYLSHTANGFSDVLAGVGIAVIAIDEPLNGARYPGYPESENLYAFYNFFNPPAVIGNHLQSAVDKITLLRLVRNWDTSGLASRTGNPVRVDGNRIAYFGHSQGGITGSIFLGVETGIDIAALSGTGGGLSITIFQRADEHVEDIKEMISTLLDLAEGEVIDLFHPLTCLIQAYGEPAEPLNYAPFYIREAPGTPKNILVFEGLQDTATPPDTTEAFAAAAGIPIIEPVARTVEAIFLRGLDPLATPVSGNLTGPSGKTATGGLLQYAGENHWTLDNPDAGQKLIDFLTSYFETGEARIE